MKKLRYVGCIIVGNATVLLLLFSFPGASFAQQVPGSDDMLTQDTAAPPSMPDGAPAVGGPASETPAAAMQAQPASTMDIQRLDTPEPLYSFELRDVSLGDLFRLLAHDYKLNLIVDKRVQGRVTASFSSVTLEEALANIAESQNLILQKKGNIIRVIPNLITQIFTLKYVEAQKILSSSAGASEGGASSAAGAGGPGGPGGAAEMAGGMASVSGEGASAKQENTIYDLLSDRGKIFLGRQPNSIIVIDYPPNAESIGAYLKVIDHKMSSKVFKLKYLKASDVVGQASGTQTAAGASPEAPPPAAGQP